MRIAIHLLRSRAIISPMEEEALVTVDTVVRETKIPRATVYKMVEEKRIPFVDVTQPWHRRRQLRFRLSEVQAALRDMGEQRRRP
jgi:excisionase family DNA binding protein